MEGREERQGEWLGKGARRDKKESAWGRARGETRRRVAGEGREERQEGEWLGKGVRRDKKESGWGRA